MVLCRAFIFISENSSKGNAVNRNRFWELVIAYFIKETGSDRTYDSIMSKWKTRICNRVSNFCAIMDNVKDTHGSGEIDADDYSKALREYRVLYGHEFALEDCWKVLRNHDAWKREMPAFQSNSRKKTKGSTTTLGSTHGPMNFQDVDDYDDEEATRESRPQGRDVARKKSSSSSKEPPTSWTSSLAKSFFKLKPLKSGKNKKLEESWKSLKEQELAMKREKMQEEPAIKREKINSNKGKWKSWASQNGSKT